MTRLMGKLMVVGGSALAAGALWCSAAAADEPPAAESTPRIEVSVYPARIEAAPGGISDPITVTVTNGGPLTTSITMTVEGVVGWSGTKAQTAEMTPGGSTVMTLYLRAPGLAGPETDNILISAVGDGDNRLTGQATLVGARRACFGDWDGLEGPTARDVIAFLGDFYRRTADFDGVDGTTVSDLYLFLDVYFDGCG